MYLTKEKKREALYQNYKPQFPKHQEVEAQLYVSQAISRDISNHMQTAVKSMSAMIVHSLMEGGGERGGK